MADHTHFNIVETRSVYALPNPTNWTEVSKVLNILYRDLGEDAYDDAVIVSATEEEILFTYKVTETRT